MITSNRQRRAPKLSTSVQAEPLIGIVGGNAGHPWQGGAQQESGLVQIGIGMEEVAREIVGPDLVGRVEEGFRAIIDGSLRLGGSCLT